MPQQNESTRFEVSRYSNLIILIFCIKTAIELQEELQLASYLYYIGVIQKRNSFIETRGACFYQNFCSSYEQKLSPLQYQTKVHYCRPLLPNELLKGKETNNNMKHQLNPFSFKSLLFWRLVPLIHKVGLNTPMK